MWKEAIVPQFEVLSWYLTEWITESDLKPEVPEAETEKNRR
jgi:hypothetical protein